VLGSLPDQAERGDVPEGGRPAVAEDDLVAVGEAEQLGEALAHGAHEVLDRGLSVGGAHHGAAEGGEVLQLLGAHLAGAGAEAPVAGQEVGGDVDRSGVGHGFTFGVGPVGRSYGGC